MAEEVLPYTSTTVTIDVMTRWLLDTIQNLNEFQRELVTLAFEDVMIEWFDTHYHPTLKQIFNAPRSFGMASLSRRYARWKRRHKGKYIKGRGVIRYLGILKMTGGMEQEVLRTRPQFSVTRGKEVRMRIVYDKPKHLGYVHEGTVYAKPRKFIKKAKDLNERKAIIMLGKKFKDMNLVGPTPQFRRSIIGRRTGVPLPTG